MSLKKLIDDKEIFKNKNTEITRHDLESLSYNTVLNFEKLLEKNNIKKSTTRSRSKSNIIKRLIKIHVKYNDLIELYYELNPLLKKVPEDINEKILKTKQKLEEKDKNNKKINDILTKYFDDFKYSVIYGIRDVNNEYDIDNMFLAKKLSIDRDLISQPEKINDILDLFSQNILGKLLESKNKLDNCIESLKEIIVDVSVDDLKFDNKVLIDTINQKINEAKLSYNEFIKNQNNTKNYGITIHKQIEININNEIKEINNLLNEFKSLIEFPNLEYISSKKYKSVSSKKVRSLDINKNKRKTLKNRYISK